MRIDHDVEMKLKDGEDDVQIVTYSLFPITNNQKLPQSEKDQASSFPFNAIRKSMQQIIVITNGMKR